MTASKRTLVCPGELRPDLAKVVGLPSDGLDCLLTVPGLLSPWEGLGEVVREPSKNLSSRLSIAHRNALLFDFNRYVDRLPRTSDWLEALRRWIDGIASERLRFRHFETTSIHTRLISGASSSVLPSAPITTSSVHESMELRVELTGTQHERVRAWFENLFGAATDVSDEVRAALMASWVGATPTARDLYHKTLAEYFRDVVEGLDAGVEDNPLVEHLTEFQRDAYIYARTILKRYGGVFLADVVGLGKTYIALALLSHLQRRYGEHAVVIAPPAVLGAWEDLAKEHRVELALVSTGKLSDLDNYSDREILVVDESHNFRNASTQRYEDLQAWLRPGGAASSRKVLLLSATPQNNRAEDVKHQLQLFPDSFSRLPFRGESLDAWFRAVSARDASLVDVLQHVVVRRTRRFIQQAHPDAVVRVRAAPGVYEQRILRFPKRVSGFDQTLRYSIDETYGAALYDSLLDAFQNLRYPLHGLGAYAREEAGSHDVISKLRRSGGTVRGLYKVLLLKRLESSVVALHTSLRRLREKLVSAIALLQDQKVSLGASQTVPDEDDDEPSASTPNGTLPASLFDSAKLRLDLQHDLEVVSSLAKQTDVLLERPDAKLERLKQYLSARPPTEHRTLVFTQFADTAEHLGRHLASHFGRTVVSIGGGAGAMNAARRFAPKANRQTIPQDQQIDLLISTDALSEGVNLQDADTLINYDIHWNPVRLIQRAGRIDRIGSEHEEIHVSSFLPERALEMQLGLETVLRRRIHEFISVFGEDSHVLPESERPVEQACVVAYTGEALKQDELKDDDLDGLSRHTERLLRLRREAPEEYARILQMRLGQHTTGSTARSVVALRRGWFWTFWSPNAESARLERLEVLQALDALHEHAEAPHAPDPTPISSSDLQVLETAREAFEPLAQQFVEQRTKPRLSSPEVYVLQQLDKYLSECTPAQKLLVNRIRAWVREGHGQTAVRRFGRTWKADRLSALVVFEETKALFARFPPRTEELGESEIVAAVFHGQQAPG